MLSFMDIGTPSSRDMYSPPAIRLSVAAAAALPYVLSHVLAHAGACAHACILGALVCISPIAHAAPSRVCSLAAASAHAAAYTRAIALRPCVIETRHIALLALQLLTYVINRSMCVYDICQ